MGKTAVGTKLFESYDNSAYPDGDRFWCVHSFSVTDKRFRNGDRSMSFVLSNYLESGFNYVFFTSVVPTDPNIRGNILNGITAKDYQIVGFTLACSGETLEMRHKKRGDPGEASYYRLHLPPYPGDVVIDTDGKSVREITREMKRHIEAETF